MTIFKTCLGDDYSYWLEELPDHWQYDSILGQSILNEECNDTLEKGYEKGENYYNIAKERIENA